MLAQKEEYINQKGGRISLQLIRSAIKLMGNLRLLPPFLTKIAYCCLHFLLLFLILLKKNSYYNTKLIKNISTVTVYDLLLFFEQLVDLVLSSGLMSKKLLSIFLRSFSLSKVTPVWRDWNPSAQDLESMAGAGDSTIRALEKRMGSRRSGLK